MNGYLADQVRLFLGTVFLAIAGLLLLAAGVRLDDVPAMRPILHSAWAILVVLPMMGLGLFAAFGLTEKIMALLGAPSDPRPRVEPETWQTLLILVLSMPVLLACSEFGLDYAQTVIAYLRPAIAPIARAVIPMFGAHREAFGYYLEATYMWVLVLPTFEIIMVVQRALGLPEYEERNGPDLREGK